MGEKVIDRINAPQDVKKLAPQELEQLCKEVREILIQTTAKTGGHLASNLGTVELTVALHRIFESPKDQIVWDVGHQCYTHKLLTGRKGQFSTLRQQNGLSGFPKRNESAHDAFLAGHSSTSVSVASGLARAKTLLGDSHSVIAVIGDGAFTSGLAYEAISNAARSGDHIIVILNDNKMSISKNAGSLAKYLAKIRSTPRYFRMKDRVHSTFGKVPVVGRPINRFLLKSKTMAKTVLYGSNFFEDLGFCYLGPVDGHNLHQLCDVLQRAKDMGRPVFLHVETQKGKGYAFAEANPGEFHGTSGFDVATGKQKPSGSSFSSEFGKYLTECAQKDSKICAITAAMKYGTGLNYFSHQFRGENRFFDVGIAEPHAVTFAGGLAANGMLPVFAVYSSFLQRSYDQILHDLSIEKQHVVLAIDRAGIVGNDGETHNGLFDVAMLMNIPGIVMYSPATYGELRWALDQALYQWDGVCTVRYPRGGEIPLEEKQFPPQQNFAHCKASNQNIVVTYGRITAQVLHAKEIWQQQGKKVSVLKLNRIFPLEEEVFHILGQYRQVLFVEEGMKTGGLGQFVGAALLERGFGGKYRVCAVDNRFVPHATVAQATALCGLDGETLGRSHAAFFEKE